MNTKDYEKKVVECLNAQQNEIILNCNIDHAEILIKQMFLNAAHTVNLLSNKLDANLYERNDIVDAIRRFLNREGTTLNIAIEGNMDQGSIQLIGLLENHDINPVRIPDWLKEQYKYNFITMDDTGYRFETDREKHEAVVNFGDTQQTEKLNNIFNTILNLA
ncbi:MAG: hypothetical protein PSN35_03040 [Candidatus Thioglobus sp.]|uniref:DUF7931 domain-containing protein n=1 Tax=Candidatus Thioglobus sp. TaxID=2026721 RepID=UPI002609D7BE|nr:hypothetical protein [Candidatus Thioglobus sp.]MDC9726798.1 hypothetical protein [Candidatus Thioglobus sp.]